MSMVYILILLLQSFLFTQTNSQISLETNYSSGLSVNPYSNQEEDYDVLENILDVNVYLTDKISFYTQIEYSNPPTFGKTRISGKNLLNSGYIEYYDDKFQLKLGDLYDLYGRGLVLNTVQDQSIDYDNKITGFSAKYQIRDNLELYSVIGFDTRFYTKNNPVDREALYYIDHAENMFGFNYDFLNSSIGFSFMDQYYTLNDSIVGMYVMQNSEFGYASSSDGDHSFGQNAFENDDVESYTVTSKIYDVNFETNVFDFDIYLEYLMNKYDYLFAYADNSGVSDTDINSHDGSMLYASVYKDLFNVGVTYEYKKYDMPYYFQTVSIPPIGYREATSTLQSRVSHQINFRNEVGHQINLDIPVGDKLSMSMNLSLAHRNSAFSGQLKTYTIDYDTDLLLSGLQNSSGSSDNLDENFSVSEPTITNYSIETPENMFMSTLFMDKEESVLAFFPFRQFYTELNGYLFNDKLNFKIGFDLFDHISEWGNATGTYGRTRSYDMYQENLLLDIESTVNGYFDTENENYFLTYNAMNCEDDEDPDACGELWYGTSLSQIEENRESALDLLLVQYPGSRTNYQSNYKKVHAITIPTQFVWNPGTGSSLSLYLEKQFKEEDVNGDRVLNSGYVDQSGTTIYDYDATYMSFTYRNSTFKVPFSMTLFYDTELKTTTSTDLDTDTRQAQEKTDSWTGYDITLEISDRSRLSLFYGSQKGGLVCANGVCGIQPEFKDGWKLNLKTMF